MKKLVCVIVLILLAIAGLKPCATSQAAEKGLVAYWSFDRISGDEVDDQSGNGLTGKVYDAEEVKGVIKGALSFKGGCVTIESNELFYPSTGITIELWFKTDVPDQFDKWMVNTIGSAHDGYRLGMMGGKVSFQIPETDWSHMLSCPAPAELNKWIYVAATYDNKTMKIFIDGEQKVSLERGGRINPSSGVCIGNYFAGQTKHFFEGILDEIKMYSRALSQDEIKEHYSKIAGKAKDVEKKPKEEKKKAKEEPVKVTGKGETFKVGKDGLVGYWQFDENLADVSGSGNDAKGEGVKFEEGKKGSALKLDGQRIEIPSGPELQLSSGFDIDCWVYFDKKPEGYPQIVYKDKEYQLRVDGESEGGQFRFFVYLDGAWEPRVGGIVPEVDKWYHLIAKWTGNEISLEVNGEKFSGPRAGMPAPTDNPAYIGYLGTGRVDELKISNPNFLKNQKINALMEKISDSTRTSQSSFGKVGGWEGWRADWGTKMTLESNAITARFPNSDAMVFNPALNVDVGKKKYVLIDIESKTSDNANLFFITGKGQGIVTFPVWDVKRTSIIDLSISPLWDNNLKFLGIFFQDNKPTDAIIQSIWISDKIEGSPFIYARNLASGRAVLRAGKEEKVIAILHSLGPEAKDIDVKLVMPDGVKILDNEVKKISSMGYDKIEKVEWKVQAEKPVSGKAKIIFSAANFGPGEKSIDINFLPMPGLPKAEYVPVPKPAKTNYIMLMHYCPLWKAGTHYGWGKIENWPERRPAIGFYDEGTPEVADWHIKYALEHGIQAFIYCWYRSDLNPQIRQNLGHAIHSGLMKAKYVDMFRFCIMWENGCGAGVKSKEDLMDNLLPFWIKNYFTHPSYLKIDNKPVLYVWVPAKVASEVGGSDGVSKVFDEMREACKKQGLGGLYIVGCVGGADKELLERMAREGWDASSAYGLWGANVNPKRDMENIITYPYEPWLEGQKEVLLGKRKVDALPDIVDVMVGWDPRPWSGKTTSSYVSGTTPEKFKVACLNAKKIVDSTKGNGLDRRVIVFDNWNEFGEGHYLEPCSGYGFGFLDTIREVFCEPESHIDIIPEDVGLETPDRIFRRMKGEIKPDAKVTGDLIGYWDFDKEDDQFIKDSSGLGFNGIKDEKYESTEGIKGKGFLCKGGAVLVASSELFYPSTGITLELWFKTDVPDQSDKWMINTIISAANTGYRLGMIGGKVSFQIPETDWSHMLSCPEPAELNKWTYVVATHDNKTMKIFIDGEQKASLERGGKINLSDANLSIGNYMSGHQTAFFEGVIDEVKIYSRELSADEIKEHFQQIKK